MRKLAVMAAVVVAAGAACVAAWRRNPRIGTRFINEVANPYLIERGASGAGRSELGTLEHVGRRTGTRHLTPVHPVPTADGFRIVVPLGPKSEWARNVIAAGHCRIQLHDTVHELDEPVLLAASEMPDARMPVAWVLDRLGVEYLLLRRFGERPGTLEEAIGEMEPGVAEQQEPAGAGAA